MADLRTAIKALSNRNVIIREALQVALVALALGCCLFGGCQTARDIRALGSVLYEAAAALSDSGTQWVVWLCAGMYCFAFTVLRERLDGTTGGGEDGILEMEDGWGGNVRRSRARRGEAVSGRLRHMLPHTVWLAGLMALVGAAYALDYAQAARSTQALTLIGTATIGQGAAVWALRSPKSKVQSLKSGRGTVVGVLVILLLGAAVWQAATGQLFQYRAGRDGLGRGIIRIRLGC